VRNGAPAGVLAALCALLPATALPGPDVGDAAACRCAGGPPHRLFLAPRQVEGVCGQLDADGAPAFFPLACGGLYFGGAGVALPLPWPLPGSGMGAVNVRCEGTTLTLRATTAAESGSNGTCTSAGCQLGPPLPVPNSRHGEASTSACVVVRTSEDLSGTADCATGAMSVAVALVAESFVQGDLLPYRCRVGPKAGSGCTTDGDCAPDGTCANDFGRCRAGPTSGLPCVLDDDCGSGGTCESGSCIGGPSNGAGCATSADCGSADAKCETLIQPCPVCNRVTHTCNGGSRDGLPCEADPSAHAATSLDCPPPARGPQGRVPLRGILTTGVTSRHAADLVRQSNVFCGFCRSGMTNRFSDPPVSCSSDADCAGLSGFTTCSQRTAGAFTPSNVARRIVVTGTAAGELGADARARPLTLAGIFCVPPGSSRSDDVVADLPGPAAITLPLVGEVR